MSLDVYQQWVADGLKRSGKSQSDLARHLGIEPSYVNRITKGVRKVQIEEVQPIAAFLGEPPPISEVLPKTTTDLVRVAMVGKVAAGLFREVDDYEDQDPVILHYPADERFPNARLLVFDVEGDSMNALRPRPILAGDRLICVSYEDVASEMPLRDGMIVVVERTKDSGQTREWSVKQLEILENQVIFHPRSLSPRYKDIVVERDAFGDGRTEVQIIAVVRQVVNTVPLGGL